MNKNCFFISYIFFFSSLNNYVIFTKEEDMR